MTCLGLRLDNQSGAVERRAGKPASRLAAPSLVRGPNV